jgi:hypothetical protein
MTLMATEKPAERTPYQAGRQPVSVTQVKCPDVDKFEARGPHVICTTCGAILRRRVRHNPRELGKFGWIEHYKDGSSFTVPPGEYVKGR